MEELRRNRTIIFVVIGVLAIILVVLSGLSIRVAGKYERQFEFYFKFYRGQGMIDAEIDHRIEMTYTKIDEKRTGASLIIISGYLSAVCSGILLFLTSFGLILFVIYEVRMSIVLLSIFAFGFGLVTILLVVSFSISIDSPIYGSHAPQKIGYAYAPAINTQFIFETKKDFNSMWNPILCSFLAFNVINCIAVVTAFFLFVLKNIGVQEGSATKVGPGQEYDEEYYDEEWDYVEEEDEDGSGEKGNVDDDDKRPEVKRSTHVNLNEKGKLGHPINKGKPGRV